MKLLRIVLFSIALVLSMHAIAATDSFTPEQTQAIQKIVKEYLLSNPTIMVEVAKKLQQQQQNDMQKKAEATIQKEKEKIFNSTGSPVEGNPQGNIILVEFFDYQCGHCKEMDPVLERLIKKNPRLKVVYKEFPIFPGSDVLSKAALASAKQGKYNEFHEALMGATDTLKKEDVIKIAEKIGLNTKTLTATMEDNDVKNEIKENLQLGDQMGLIGTPAYIIGKSDGKNFAFIAGTTSESDLQEIIKQMQKAQ